MVKVKRTTPFESDTNLRKEEGGLLQVPPRAHLAKVRPRVRGFGGSETGVRRESFRSYRVGDGGHGCRCGGCEFHRG
jgi:hypothetical protein